MFTEFYSESIFKFGSQSKSVKMNAAANTINENNPNASIKQKKSPFSDS